MRVSVFRHSLFCRTLWCLFSLVLTLPIAADETAAEKTASDESERFYRIEMGGQPAGWLVERTIERETDFGVVLITESETRMELSRAGTETAVEMFSRFEETADHRPVSGLMRQTLGATPLETSFRFGDGEVLVSEPGGTERRREMGEKTWMTPVEAGEHVTRQVRRAYEDSSPEALESQDEGFVFEVRRLELPTGLEPITGRYVLQDADDPIEIDGNQREAGRWAMSESYAPFLTTLAWIDRDGVLLRTEASMMGTAMVMTLTADDPRAENPGTPGRGPAERPEMLVQSFIRPDRPIASPRAVRRAVFRLRVDGLEADLLKELVPSAGAQTVQVDRDGLRVTVDLDHPATDPTVDDPEIHLRPSRYLDFESQPVRELLTTWRQDRPEPETGGSPEQRAESLRRLVASHLQNKNLGTVLGSASETATSGAGDCTEHAVLLAALLRAEGIPSRVAVGLVYARQFAGKRDIFVYHMWTQAQLEEGGDQARWVDLDATLPNTTPFDATHILFATSPLTDEGVPLVGTGAEAVFGRLSIAVLESEPAQDS